MGFCQRWFLFIVWVCVLLLVFQTVGIYNHSCLSTQASLSCVLTQILNQPWPLSSGVFCLLSTGTMYLGLFDFSIVKVKCLHFTVF